MAERLKQLRSRLGRGLNAFSYEYSRVAADGALAQVRAPREEGILAARPQCAGGGRRGAAPGRRAGTDRPSPTRSRRLRQVWTLDEEASAATGGPVLSTRVRGREGARAKRAGRAARAPNEARGAGRRGAPRRPRRRDCPPRNRAPPAGTPPCPGAPSSSTRGPRGGRRPAPLRPPPPPARALQTAPQPPPNRLQGAPFCLMGTSNLLAMYRLASSRHTFCAAGSDSALGRVFAALRPDAPPPAAPAASRGRRGAGCAADRELQAQRCRIRSNVLLPLYDVRAAGGGAAGGDGDTSASAAAGRGGGGSGAGAGGDAPSAETAAAGGALPAAVFELAAHAPLLDFDAAVALLNDALRPEGLAVPRLCAARALATEQQALGELPALDEGPEDDEAAAAAAAAAAAEGFDSVSALAGPGPGSPPAAWRARDSRAQRQSAPAVGARPAGGGGPGAGTGAGAGAGAGIGWPAVPGGERGGAQLEPAAAAAAAARLELRSPSPPASPPPQGFEPAAAGLQSPASPGPWLSAPGLRIVPHSFAPAAAAPGPAAAAERSPSPPPLTVSGAHAARGPQRTRRWSCMRAGGPPAPGTSGDDGPGHASAAFIVTGAPPRARRRGAARPQLLRSTGQRRSC
jgi:hypothetical protein